MSDSDRDSTPAARKPSKWLRMDRRIKARLDEAPTHPAEAPPRTAEVPKTPPAPQRSPRPSQDASPTPPAAELTAPQPLPEHLRDKFTLNDRTQAKLLVNAEQVRSASLGAVRKSLEVGPGPSRRTVRTRAGQVLEVPAGWELLPPGDATLTRRVKKAGPSWTVYVLRKKQRRTSVGVWADADRIARLRDELERERQTVDYKRKLQASRERRAREQARYVDDFEQAVIDHLGFASCHAELAGRVARAVTEHATPVGSGTVARTERIPVDERARRAVTAWLRHRTTNYDQRKFRNKGERAMARRELAKEGQRLLARYRRGEVMAAGACPLTRAVDAYEARDAPVEALNPFRNRRPRKGRSGAPRGADEG